MTIPWIAGGDGRLLQAGSRDSWPSGGAFKNNSIPIVPVHLSWPYQQRHFPPRQPGDKAGREKRWIYGLRYE